MAAFASCTHCPSATADPAVTVRRLQQARTVLPDTGDQVSRASYLKSCLLHLMHRGRIKLSCNNKIHAVAPNKGKRLPQV